MFISKFETLFRNNSRENVRKICNLYILTIYMEGCMDICGYDNKKRVGKNAM